MKKIVCVLFVLLCINSISVFAQQKKEVLFQYSPIASLLEGVYDGSLTIAEFKKHGNFGLGTLNNLDGEMLVFNDTVYQVRSDGIPIVAAENIKIPFGTIVTFKPGQDFQFNESVTLADFQKMIDEKVISDNLIYAVKVEGTFPFIRVRSVPAQDRPYPRLIDAIKNQAVFEYKDIKGTLVGFKIPKYMDGVNVPGYHFHFISADRKHGGHVLDCTTGGLFVQLQAIDGFELMLPDSEDFLKKKNVSSNEKELKKIESLIKEK